MDDLSGFRDHRDRHLDAVGPEPDPYRGGPGSESWAPDDHWARSRHADLVTDLIAAVGGADALTRVHADPLPDEPFEWSVVPDRDAAFVAEVLAAADPCCDALLDTEFRTIARRILARVARFDPRPTGSAPGHEGR